MIISIITMMVQPKYQWLLGCSLLHTVKWMLKNTAPFSAICSLVEKVIKKVGYSSIFDVWPEDFIYICIYTYIHVIQPLQQGSVPSDGCTSSQFCSMTSPEPWFLCISFSSWFLVPKDSCLNSLEVIIKAKYTCEVHYMEYISQQKIKRSDFSQVSQ